MTRLYIQWAVIAVAATSVSLAAARYYDRHLVTVTPSAVLALGEDRGSIRVEGFVEAGSLSGDLDSGHAEFLLSHAGDVLSVEYAGAPPENLRELKTLVVVGRWNRARSVFEATDVALITNYRFVVGAYLAALIPLAVFIFLMERRVRLLYHEIKEAKLYESEAATHVDAG